MTLHPPKNSDRRPTHAARWGAYGVLGLSLVGLALTTAGWSRPGPAGAPAADLVEDAEAQAGRAVLGARWHVAPDLGPLISDETATLDEIRAHQRAGDGDRAAREAQHFLAKHPHGRDAAALWMLVGLNHREAGRHNLASEAFTHVRASKGPLAEWGAWHEAEQDLERGRPWVALRECEAYVKSYPEGHFIGACQRLVARSYAETGNYTRARTVSAEYDAEHSEAPISEQVEISIAKHSLRTDEASAIPALRALAIAHSAPLTGRWAEAELQRLHDAGYEDALVPTDDASLMRRAISLRDARRKAEAWQTFDSLRQRAADLPEVNGFITRESETFGWRTHQWDFLVDTYTALYEAEGKADQAWDVYRALFRGGRYAEACDFAAIGMKRFGSVHPWRTAQEDISRSMLLAGRYAEARTLLDAVTERGGWTGRRSAFYAGFSSYMLGEHEDAVARFDKIIAKDASHEEPARYWRAKVYDALERSDEAAADRAWVTTNEPYGWYATLVNQVAPQPADPLAIRKGRWAGPAPLSISSLPDHGPSIGNITVSPKLTSAASLAPSKGLGQMRWAEGWAGVLSTRDLPPPAPPSLVDLRGAIVPPPSYQSSVIFDEATAEAEAKRFVQRYEKDWPELTAVVDFARVGLYDEAGPLLSQTYEDWREAYNTRSNPRHLAARKLPTNHEEWRNVFLFARDHHHTARFLYGLWDQVEDPNFKEPAYRLGYPLAHDHTVWAHARSHDIDPLLVMGLMRQESTYNAVAKSRVGARGAMQIMPRTGHLMADLEGMHDFTAGDLEDPLLSIQLGVDYLGRLNERFEGAWPLAVASYNGGPFNVSKWLSGTGAEMPMDEWVEHIPFRETRDYVKKVTSGYSAYAQLYAPPGSRVLVPATPRGDHPEIVDF